MAVVLVFLLTVAVSAHGGRTDSQGGHYDRSMGEYHFHHGYPAHQHENGVCPYEFDDRTGEDSGGSGRGGTNTDTTTETKRQSGGNREKENNLFYDIVFLVVVATFLLIPENKSKRKTCKKHRKR